MIWYLTSRWNIECENLPDEVMNLWIFTIWLTLSGCQPHTSSVWPWSGAPKVHLYNTFLGSLRHAFSAYFAIPLIDGTDKRATWKHKSEQKHNVPSDCDFGIVNLEGTPFSLKMRAQDPFSMHPCPLFEEYMSSRQIVQKRCSSQIVS